MHALTPLAAANPVIHAFDGGLVGAAAAAGRGMGRHSRLSLCLPAGPHSWQLRWGVPAASLPHSCCAPLLSRCPLGPALLLLPVDAGPALFLDALWLPFRRNRGELEAALAAASSQSAAHAGSAAESMAASAATHAASGVDGGASGGAGGPLLQAVFAHTDIVGALMNEAYQAHDGLPPDLFPVNIPTYTGAPAAPHRLCAVLLVGAAGRGEAGTVAAACWGSAITTDAAASLDCGL